MKKLLVLMLLASVAYGQSWDSTKTSDNPRAGMYKFNSGIKEYILGKKADTTGWSGFRYPVMVLQGDSLWVAKEGVVVGADSGYVTFMADDDSLVALKYSDFANSLSAINRSLLAPVINVKSTGAVGNAVTNDRVAIQKAIDSANASTVAKTVYIPDGTFIADSLFVKSGVSFSGRGTLKLPASSNNALLYIVEVSNVAIEDVTIDGNRANQTNDTTTYGIYIDSVSDLSVRNVKLQNTKSPGIWLLGGGKRIRIESNSLVNCGRDSLNSGAIYFSRSDNDTLSDVIIADNFINNTTIATGGIKLAATAGTMERVLISGNSIVIGETASIDVLGIELWTSGAALNKDINITGNIIADEDSGSTANQFGISVAGQGNNENVVVGKNTIRNMGGSGMGIELIGSDISCVNNALINSGSIAILPPEPSLGKSANNVVVTGNTQHNAQDVSYAIRIQGDSADYNNIIVSDNIVDSPAGTGIVVGMGAGGDGFNVTNLTISGNMLSGMVGAAIVVGESLTVSRMAIKDNIVSMSTTGDFDGLYIGTTRDTVEHLTVEGNHFNNIARHGLYFNTLYLGDIDVVGNTFDSCATSGITLGNARRVKIDNNTFRRCVASVVLSNVSQIDFRNNTLEERTRGIQYGGNGVALSDVNISNNTMKSPTYSAMEFNSPSGGLTTISNVLISRNRIFYPDSAAIAFSSESLIVIGVNIVGNIIVEPTYDGVYLGVRGTGTKNFLVSENRFINIGRHAVYINTPANLASWVNVTNNSIDSCVGSGFYVEHPTASPRFVNNTVQNVDYAAVLDTCTSIAVWGNHVSGQRDGIYLTAGATFDSANGQWLTSGTETGDIEAVGVTAPITGGGTSGSVTIGIDTTSALAYVKALITGKLSPSDSTAFLAYVKSQISGVSTNYTPKWDGSKFVNSGILWTGSWADFAGGVGIANIDPTISMRKTVSGGTFGMIVYDSASSDYAYFRFDDDNDRAMWGVDADMYHSIMVGGGEIVWINATTVGINQSLSVSGEFTGSAQIRGTNAFTGTAEHDTVAVTGASVNDFYYITYTGTAAAGANDASPRVEATATGFILHRPASGTSGLTYNWLRMK